MLIISRFEENWAVMELDDTTFNVPKILFPQKAKEGDIINISITVNQEATVSRKQQISELFKDLFEEEGHVS